jgi:ribonuclease R
LEIIAKHCSLQEIKAEKLEYKIKDYYIVKYYKNKVWQEFDWIINWVIPKWFFVILKDTAEWYVELKKSEYNEVLKTHTDLSNWKKYRLWDRVKVKLVDVDEKMYRLNFEIVI